MGCRRHPWAPARGYWKPPLRGSGGGDGGGLMEGGAARIRLVEYVTGVVGNFVAVEKIQVFFLEAATAVVFLLTLDVGADFLVM